MPKLLRRCVLLVGAAGSLSGCGVQMQNGLSATGASLGGSPYGYSLTPAPALQPSVAQPTTGTFGFGPQVEDVRPINVSPLAR